MHAMERLLRAPRTISFTLLVVSAGCGDTTGTSESGSHGLRQGCQRLAARR